MIKHDQYLLIVADCDNNWLLADALVSKSLLIHYIFCKVFCFVFGAYLDL